MRKRVLSVLAIPLALLLASWGFVGHQAVGIIAENHLTPRAKEGVNLLLAGQSLKDVANWADDIIDEKTFPEHFINVPLGLTRQQFDNEIAGQPQDNVYKALIAKQAAIKNPATSAEEKQQALKFIVHFVGDLHQPFHVSRKEDQGGNTIPLKFEGKDVNLHSLWDSRMISKQGLNAAGIARAFDKASPGQIRQWQADDLKQWLWESYQLSTLIYNDSKPGTQLGREYYKRYIPIVDERIEKAGIRLAGLLNRLFTADVIAALKRNPLPTAPAVLPTTYTPVLLDEAAKHIGENVKIKATAAGYKELDGLLLIDLGSPHPNNPLTLVFRGDARAWGEKIKAPGTKLVVLGKLVEFKGKPQIKVTGETQLRKE